MEKIKLNILLADDDIDDCDFFDDALNDLAYSTKLTSVNDGVKLMDLLLSESANYPDLIFLDLNMPRKSGMECLLEIKATDSLNHIPIIIYSTSLDRDVLDLLYKNGAHYYLRKPGEFSVLKSSIQKAIDLFSTNKPPQPTKDKFIIQP
jgi:CheY-like chemotaxis protein